MCINLLRRLGRALLFLGPKPDSQFTCLVVGAVGAGDQFLVLFLEGEDGLEVVLGGCCVVQGRRHDGDDAVGELESFVKLL